MIPGYDNQNNYIMTPEAMASFIADEMQKGASANMIRRFSCTLNEVYAFLPEDKLLTKEHLIAWRQSLIAKGYSPVTVLNHVKYINRYLDFAGCSEIRFNRGKSKDITNMTVGYLTALEPTEKRNRKDIVWLCQCRCGNIVELPATRLLCGNTRSCGCLLKDHLERANKYIENTSLRKALDETVENAKSKSGYVGVAAKRGKWQAHITYKGKRYSLGTYTRIEDAVAARARAKEWVKADAQKMLELYEKIHEADPPLPQRKAISKKSLEICGDINEKELDIKIVSERQDSVKSCGV